MPYKKQLGSGIRRSDGEEARGDGKRQGDGEAGAEFFCWNNIWRVSYDNWAPASAGATKMGRSDGLGQGDGEARAE